MQEKKPSFSSKSEPSPLRDESSVSRERETSISREKSSISSEPKPPEVWIVNGKAYRGDEIGAIEIIRDQFKKAFQPKPKPKREKTLSEHSSSSNSEENIPNPQPESHFEPISEPQVFFYPQPQEEPKRSSEDNQSHSLLNFSRSQIPPSFRSQKQEPEPEPLSSQLNYRWVCDTCGVRLDYNSAFYHKMQTGHSTTYR